MHFSQALWQMLLPRLAWHTLTSSFRMLGAALSNWSRLLWAQEHCARLKLCHSCLNLLAAVPEGRALSPLGTEQSSSGLP